MIQNILFVCLGNICRSPMAEFVAKDILSKKYPDLKLQIKSAGTANYHVGEPMHKGTASLLKEKQIPCDGFSAKQINDELWSWADIILVMDKKNILALTSMYKEDSRIKLITDYSPNKVNEVPDPWYTGNFEEVYEILSDSIDNYFKTLI